MAAGFLSPLWLNFAINMKITKGFFFLPSDVADKMTVTQVFSCPVVAIETVCSPLLVIVLELGFSKNTAVSSIA